MSTEQLALLIMDQTQCTLETALEALIKYNNDIVTSIMVFFF